MPRAPEARKFRNTLAGSSLAMLLLAAGCAGPRAVASPGLTLTTVPRVEPDAVRARVANGQALLVCAFSAENRCFRDTLKKALTLDELRARLPRLPKGQELIFYCACAGDSTALKVAAWFRGQGFTHVKVLRGGPAAWQGLEGTI